MSSEKQQATGERKEYKHWIWCNGNRSIPAGEPGHSCCCFNEASVRKGLVGPVAQQPTDGALRDLIAKWRERSAEADYVYTAPTWKECADELERALAAQPAPVADNALLAVESAVNALHQCIHKSGAMYQIRECIERIDAALRALVAQATQQVADGALREKLVALVYDLNQHSNKNIHDSDLMCRSQAAVEGVIADRITKLLKAQEKL